MNSYVCDRCNRNLDWEPFPVIVFPTREELKDPYYVPAGGDALCRACARKWLPPPEESCLQGPLVMVVLWLG
jgi:hypothetical protein